MRSELTNTEGSLVADDGIQLIFEGVKRDLKLQQTAMVKHGLVVEDGRTFIASKVDVFARGRTLVLGALGLLLLFIFVAIYQSAESVTKQLDLFKTMVFVVIIFIPIGLAYLGVEKRLQHYRLHQKVASKLKEMTKAESMVKDLLDK